MKPSTSHQDEQDYPHASGNSLGLGIGTLLVGSGFGMNLAFIPLVLQEMGYRENVETWAGYAVGGFMAVSFLLTPFWAVVADHFGRKTMVLRAAFGMGTFFVLLHFISSPFWFVVVYVIAGSTQGYIGASQAMIATTTPPIRMGRALSRLQSGNLIGNALGPALGAWLGWYYQGYGNLYGVGGLLVLCGGVASLIWVREERRPPQGPFRVNLLGDLKRIVRLPTVPLLYAATFCYAVTVFGSISVISVYAIQLMAGEPAYLGMGVNFWVGAASMAVTVSSGLAVHLWGWLLDRIGGAPTLALALLTGAVTAFPVAFVRTPLELVAARVLTGCAITGIMPAMVALTRMASPAGMEARVLGWGTTFNILGMTLGPLVAGWIGPWLGLRFFFALNGVLLLSVCLLWVRGWRGRAGLGQEGPLPPPPKYGST